MFSIKSGRVFVSLFFIALASTSVHAKREKDATLRVNIMDLTGPVIISGKNIRIEQGIIKSGRIRADSVSVEPAGDNVIIAGKSWSVPVSIKSESGELSVRGRAYRGDLAVVKNEGLVLVNEVSVEHYLYGVINNEISSSWPVEAVKAQAVLARTYAVMRREQRKDKPYHLDSTVSDQVYMGKASEDKAARDAVDATRGMILSYKGEPIEALYHSSCGGRTESPHYVWGGVDKPYQQSVNCGFCEEAPHYFWRFPINGSLSGAEMSALLGLKDSVKAVRVIERSPSGRILKVRFRTGDGDTIFSGSELRKKIGYDQIRSTAFEIKLEGDGLVFLGSGSGHGVGMCQWGARGMAEQGFHFEEILLHYFPGTNVSKMRW